MSSQYCPQETRPETTVTQGIRTFHLGAAVASTLRNSTQAQQRSIVRITFVSGKRKLGCIITNCFQIGSFFQSKLLPKLRADTDTVTAEPGFAL